LYSRSFGVFWWTVKTLSNFAWCGN